MITFDEATALVAGTATALGVERVPLSRARGRVLATPVHAGCASPAVDVSAMDGYAVRDADLLTLPASLAIVGESFAGAGFSGDLPHGGCVRIFTGAPMPAGADRVIVQEEVLREGSRAIFERGPSARRHLRRAGSDFRVGDRLIPAGSRLNAQRLIAIAAANLGEIEVYRRPTVSILATGDELAEPGSPGLCADSIPDSVSFGVAALCEDLGAMVVARRRCGDDLPLLRAAAAVAVREADVVVTIGGASVGERDLARDMFAPLGLEMVFSKVAIKPGKPVWIGRAGDAIVVGLPGNPTSALVTARLFLAPLLAGLAGRDPREALAWRLMTLAGAMPREGDREAFHRAWGAGQDVTLADDQDSSAQRALAASTLLVRRRPGEPAAAAGSLVEVLDL